MIYVGGTKAISPRLPHQYLSQQDFKTSSLMGKNPLQRGSRILIQSTSRRSEITVYPYQCILKEPRIKRCSSLTLLNGLLLSKSTSGPQTTLPIMLNSYRAIFTHYSIFRGLPFFLEGPS